MPAETQLTHYLASIHSMPLMGGLMLVLAFGLLTACVAWSFAERKFSMDMKLKDGTIRHLQRKNERLESRHMAALGRKGLAAQGEKETGRMSDNSQATKQIGRLAMRIEGLWWRAYYAMPDTMDGAILLGCIHRQCVEKNPAVKQQFMDAMQAAVGALLEQTTGHEVVEWKTQVAPEHERSGSA